jgi:hypothetical protein
VGGPPREGAERRQPCCHAYWLGVPQPRRLVEAPRRPKSRTRGRGIGRAETSVRPVAVPIVAPIRGEYKTRPPLKLAGIARRARSYRGGPSRSPRGAPGRAAVIGRDKQRRTKYQPPAPPLIQNSKLAATPAPPPARRGSARRCARQSPSSCSWRSGSPCGAPHSGCSPGRSPGRTHRG